MSIRLHQCWIVKTVHTLSSIWSDKHFASDRERERYILRKKRHSCRGVFVILVKLDAQPWVNTRGMYWPSKAWTDPCTDAVLTYPMDVTFTHSNQQPRVYLSFRICTTYLQEEKQKKKQLIFVICQWMLTCKNSVLCKIFISLILTCQSFRV